GLLVSSLMFTAVKWATPREGATPHHGVDLGGGPTQWEETNMPEIVPTRRTVIRTAAWAVPAVSVAAAAPAFATSPGGEPGATYTTVTRNFTFVSTNALGTFD